MGWTLDDLKLGILTKDTPKDQIPDMSGSVYMKDNDQTVYAVWAEDRNDNGKPDYQEEPITVTFEPKDGTAQGTTTFILKPFPEGNDTRVGQAPAVIAPQDQVFVNWTLRGDKSKTLSNGEYFTYDSMFKIANGKTVLTFEANYRPESAEPDYTLTYNANNGYWGTEDVQEQKETGLPTAEDVNGWHTLIYSDAATAPKHDPVPVEGKDVKVLFVGWTLDDTKLGILTKDTLKDQIPDMSESVDMSKGDRTVYAVWAEDRNDNGKPDYQEEPITVIFDLKDGTTQGTTTFTLKPFPEGNDTRVGQAPAVTAPQDQVFVNWTLQGDTSKTLSDGEYFTYDTMFKMANGKTDLVFEANYQYQGTITITPRFMTVYMGGHGYTGVVKDEDTGEIVTEEENGFPVPGFVIKLPAELEGNFDVSKLRLKYDGNPIAENEAERLDYTWEFVPYDNDKSHEVYFIKPVEGTAERSVRIQFTSTVTGDVFTSDTFEAGRNINQELKMEVYGEGIDAHKVYFAYEGKQYNVGVGEATLTVRGTSPEVKFSNDDKITAEHPKFDAAEGTTYTINGSEIQVTDSTGVALLFDEILDTKGTTDRSDLLENRAEAYFEKEGITASEGNTFDYQLKYLDLVDTKNGNAWVVADKPVTISWPVPEGVDASTVRILHYKDVDRSSAEEDIAAIINDCTVQDMKAVVVDGYATFTVEPGNFSPFAMVWETKDTTPTGNKLTYYPNGGSGDPIVYYTTDKVETVSNNLFTRVDYTFDSWNTAADGSGTEYVPGSAIRMNGDVDLYAQWVKNGSGDGGSDGGDATQNEFELHYVTNGGKHLSVESEIRVWTKDYRDLPVPVREGYTFEGWYWDLRLTDRVTGDVKVDVPVVVLYAKWAEEETAAESTGVSRWLDTVNHTAYLSGYPDGTFGTDKNMTRAEVAQMFYALLLDKDVEITTSFSDVPADAWYAKAVNTLSSLGMLGGYPDGTYRPDAPITRAEFAAVALAFANEPAAAGCSYTDVSADSWYYTYVAQASTYGWIGGYPDNTFRPDNKITRAEVCVIVNNMLGRAADQRYIDRNADELTSFADLTSNHWAYYTIMEATNFHKYSVDDGVESWSRVN